MRWRRKKTKRTRQNDQQRHLHCPKGGNRKNRSKQRSSRAHTTISSYESPLQSILPRIESYQSTANYSATIRCLVHKTQYSFNKGNNNFITRTKNKTSPAEIDKQNSTNIFTVSTICNQTRSILSHRHFPYHWTNVILNQYNCISALVNGNLGNCLLLGSDAAWELLV